MFGDVLEDYFWVVAHFVSSGFQDVVDVLSEVGRKRCRCVDAEADVSGFLFFTEFGDGRVYFICGFCGWHFLVGDDEEMPTLFDEQFFDGDRALVFVDIYEADAMGILFVAADMERAAAIANHGGRIGEG